MDSGASRKGPSVDSHAMCNLCSKKFSCVKLLNRHKKRIHKIVAVSSLRECRVICPICEERDELKSYDNLRRHLIEKHALSMEFLKLQFLNMQEFKSWRQDEKIETSYAVQRTNRGNDHKEIHYICNRSDSKGYQAKYKKRTEKSGGTIKIRGMCPSQLICKLYEDGTVSVSFWKTHAGHENELRSVHLSLSEKKTILNKLKSGVTADRILDDARKAASELQRINFINSDDITYIARKHNINKKRDCNERIAATMEVQDGNANKKKIAISVSEESKDQNTREVRWALFKNWAESLNDDIFDTFMSNIQGAIREADQTNHKVTHNGNTGIISTFK